MIAVCDVIAVVDLKYFIETAVCDAIAMRDQIELFGSTVSLSSANVTSIRQRSNRCPRCDRDHPAIATAKRRRSLRSAPHAGSVLALLLALGQHTLYTVTHPRMYIYTWVYIYI